MAVLTGRSGQLYVGNTRVARCTGWSLDEQRPMLESTPLDSWNRVVVPGRRSGTGSAKLLYDPDDAAAGVFFDSILLDTKNEVPISLFLDSLTGESYPVTVHVSGASHAVAKGEAQMRDISFKLSDISVELQIIGNAEVANGATQLYTGAVYGLSGAWTFLWTSSGPTIADPTSQSTNITFPDLGTFTLTLTATLGATVLTDTLTIEVVSFPLMWVSRTTSLQSAVGDGRTGIAGLDIANQYVYSIQAVFPDSSVATSGFILSKLNYAGNRLITKRLTGVLDAPAGDIAGVCQVLSNGDVLLCFRRNTAGVGGALLWMRVTPDLSTIVWQFRTTVEHSPAKGVYDPATERYFFCFTEFSTPNRFSYIDLAAGTLIAVNMTTSDGYTLSSGGCIKLADGKVLFVMGTSSNGVCFVECNTDLKVGVIFQPIRTVHHIFTDSVGTKFAVMETTNYIVLTSDSILLRFNKSDYTYVDGRNTNTPGGDLLFSCFSGSEIVVAKDGGASFGQTGLYLARFDEDMTFLGGGHLMPTLTGSGPPYANNAPGAATRTIPITWGLNYSSAFHVGLNVFAIHVQQSVGSTNREMVWFGRFEYSANYLLDYGVSFLSVDDTGEGATSARAVSTTTSRSWSFTQVTPGSVATSGTLITEADMTFQEYALAAP